MKKPIALGKFVFFLIAMMFSVAAGPAFAGPNAAPAGSGLERGPHKLQIIHQLRGLQTVRVGLGGNLVLLGVGVDEGTNVDAPSSLSGRPVADRGPLPPPAPGL